MVGWEKHVGRRIRDLETDDLQEMVKKINMLHISFIAEKDWQPTFQSANYFTSVAHPLLTCNGFSLSCCGVPTLPSVPEYPPYASP